MQLLPDLEKRFNYYKSLGERAFEGLEVSDFHWQYNPESNSIAIIVNHLWGNMLSRFTNFLTEDGEKEWRKRDMEFENLNESVDDLMKKWNDGWRCVTSCLESLREDDLAKTVYIRTEPHSAFDAINRQLAHYAAHVGQIIYIARMLKGPKWKSLSIPRGQSDAFNKKYFEK